MRVFHIASEIYPLAKTGGLGDVTAALLPALNEIGIDARLLLPGYAQAIDRSKNPHEVAKLDGLLGLGRVRLLSAWLPGSMTPIWLVECPDLYDRAGGIYQNAHGEAWHDNALRFALLNHVAAAIASGRVSMGWKPDVLHAHDWHAGLVPLLLRESAGPQPLTVLTIHNLAYQGVFPFERFRYLGLPERREVYSALEFFGQISFLKAGIVAANALTTVSPTYAKEILTPEYGCGLDGLLQQRAGCLTGIMNGADYRVWDPAHDPDIAATFTSRHIAGKQACKISLQEEMGLSVSLETPLVAFSSRLAHQKMPDLVLEALPAIMAQGAQFALVAEGDPDYEARFRELAAGHPGQVAVRIGYEEPLAHRLLAGADVLLHPSRFEPCGLTPIYAMRYGTLPAVRRSGGTADSVVDAIEQTIHCEQATGFTFTHPTADDLIACVRRTLAVYRQPIAWRKIQLCAMRQDFGWRRPAQNYVSLYRGLLADRLDAQATDERQELMLIA